MKSSQGIKSSALTDILIPASGTITQQMTVVNTSNVDGIWWIGDDSDNFVEFPANTSEVFGLQLNDVKIHFGPKTSGTVTAWGLVY